MSILKRLMMFLIAASCFSVGLRPLSSCSRTLLTKLGSNSGLVSSYQARIPRHSSSQLGIFQPFVQELIQCIVRFRQEVDGSQSVNKVAIYEGKQGTLKRL